MKLYAALSVAFLLLLPILPGASQEDDDATAIDDTPHVTIVGTARRDVAPDLATLSLGVTNEAPDAAGAARANAAAAQALVAAATAAGVAPADIATRSVTLVQTFDDVTDGNGRVTGRRPRGFEASHGYAIRVRGFADDPGKVGTVAQALVEKGATRFNGVSFGLADPQPVLDQLAAEATTNARRQAEKVAAAAGVHLGRVLLVERPDAARPPMSNGPVVRALAMPIEAGTQELSASMEVTWAIE